MLSTFDVCSLFDIHVVMYVCKVAHPLTSFHNSFWSSVVLETFIVQQKFSVFV